MTRILLRAEILVLTIALSGSCSISGYAADEKATAPEIVAANIDRMILEAEGLTEFPAASRSTILRRLSLDLIGRPPSIQETLNWLGNGREEEEQETEVIEELLASAEYGENWSRYWRETMFARATNTRTAIVRSAFEVWLAEQFNENVGWDSIVTELLTATGDVDQDGETALMFAHEGVPEEIAAEASRLFLGIQIQCANCHDHPWDRWKRDQFHELVAFFPRVSVRRDPTEDRPSAYIVTSMDRSRRPNAQTSRILLGRLDRNRDGFISDKEAEGTRLEQLLARGRAIIDKNGDNRLSIEEIATAEPPNNRPGQGSTEHYMPDLSDPGSQGTQVDPSFFLTSGDLRSGLSDSRRRSQAAAYFTAEDNVWFRRALVNRLWYELTGAAFYAPIDDIGPDRTAMHPEALDYLGEQFAASGYDLKYLLRVITATRFYHREVNADASGFARYTPMRLRSDQLYDSFLQVFSVAQISQTAAGVRLTPRDRARGEVGRILFANTFGFDPSKPREEILGSIPEALFLMNSRPIDGLVELQSGVGTVSRIMSRFNSPSAQVNGLYLVTLGREARPEEQKTAIDYIDTSLSVREGLEDLLWVLVNSTEFQTRR